MEFSDVDNPKAAQDKLRSSKMKRPAEVQDIDNTSMRTVSVSPDEGGDGEDIEGAEIEQWKG
jgi:hypothetical protein